MKTITLVATQDRLAADFPKRFRPSADHNPGIQSADYEVDPSACATALGRWLADTVTTTRFDSEASVARILLPQTSEGLYLRELAERLIQRQIASEVDLETLFSDLEAWIAQRRAAVRIAGSAAFQHLVVQFRWPVFGSAAAEGASAPETYFDICAKQMRATGGVIVDVGGVELPEGLAKTMAGKSGGGDRLLRLHREQVLLGN